MFTFKVSEEVRKACPDYIGAAIYATVKNSLHSEELWEKIDAVAAEYKATHQIDEVKKNRHILATRNAYKKFGKDPNRYRPSAEALCRRILRGLPLYKIDTLVDLINLVSIRTGYSIGGFDAGKISGDILELVVGKADEPFEGIGRGILNIEGLPVYRDAVGGIGTPTSDNERTKLSVGTTQLLAVINGYSGKEGLTEAVAYMQSLLREFAASDGGEVVYF
ncbi:phenylalanine--tRNA ligase beta subunit-related protein [uncultured Bacteroides sp.]|uniref:B3/B4 domain-containing protein n=1 Tax=uncultured Bacteroides sp. TaxID=162156 RepID=UPI002AABD81F|nr:phenylalanine--tRNA ligase beta subunit-related protein [uncultured Bacteroides sp.]